MGKNAKHKLRVYMNESEIGALSYLKQLPDFKNSTPSQIIKACIITVALDVKLKLEAANKKKAEESNSDKSSGE